MGHGTRVNECCRHLHCAHYLGNYKRFYSHHRQRSKSKGTCMLLVLTVPCKTSSPHLLVFAISRPIIPKRQPEQIHSLSPTGKFPPGAGEELKWKLPPACLNVGDTGEMEGCSSPARLYQSSDSALSTVSRQEQAE